MNRMISGIVLAASALCATVPAVAGFPDGTTAQSMQDGSRTTPTFRPAILQVQSQDRFPDDFSDMRRQRQGEEKAAKSFFVLMMLFMIVCVAGYAIPIIIAFTRGHAYRWPITAVTILGGWTGFGWVAALIWSLLPADGGFTAPRMDLRWKRDDGLDRIVRLAELRERGIITEEEFTTAKAEILARA